MRESKVEGVLRGRGLLKRRTEKYLVITSDDARKSLEFLQSERIKKFIPPEGKRVIFEAKQQPNGQWACTWIKLEKNETTKQAGLEGRHEGPLRSSGDSSESAPTASSPESSDDSSTHYPDNSGTQIEQGAPVISGEPDSTAKGEPVGEGEGVKEVEPVKPGVYIVMPDGSMVPHPVDRESYWSLKLTTDLARSDRIQLQQCLQIAAVVLGLDTKRPDSTLDLEARLNDLKEIAANLNHWIRNGGCDD